ncbi:MAG: hypothetical protein K0S98_1428, partial [Propionibacteriaceae bacterium]|nr:hypothetical protein [Propionibacteriaceae bacterium]
MTHRRSAVVVLAVSLAGCAGEGTTASVAPDASSDLIASGSSAPSATTTAGGTLVDVPAGRILFHRMGSDGVEHYFTINTDGTDERAIFDAEGCGCARFAPDGPQVWTMGSTGHGTWSFTTVEADGSDRVVVEPPIETLNLGPAAPSIDGDWIAF